MLEITPATRRHANACAQAYQALASQRGTPATPPSGPAELTDRVELSASAAEQGETARARSADVAEVRERIANGTYITPDKIDLVVERLHARLVLESVDAA